MTSPETSDADVVVVGGGPAGMAAAATALEAGLSVTLLDAGHGLGGQYWRHPPERAAGAIPVADLHHDLGTYAALSGALRAAAADGRLDLRLRHQAWTVERGAAGIAVHAAERSLGPDRAVTARGARLVLATGAYDRQIPFPGWDLPGVMTAGGLQALLKGNGVLAGRRVVVGGTGPFLLPVATGLAARGARVVAVCEAGHPAAWLRHPQAMAAAPAKLGEGLAYARTLLRHRIPVRVRTAVVAAHGTDRVEAVTVARLDAAGRVRPGSQRQVEVDAVGVGWGFVPQLDLAVTLGCRLVPSPDGNEVVDVDDHQRSDVPGVYVAGEGCGVGGAALAVLEGRLAGLAVTADAGRARPRAADTATDLRRRIRRHRAFARAMATAHPVPPAWPEWLEDDTTVCRCEEVTAAEVRAACVRDGARDARQVKQLTRTGMGWCQGRMCGYAAHCLAAGWSSGPSEGASAPSPAPERLVAAPVTLGALADGPTAER